MQQVALHEVVTPKDVYFCPEMSTNLLSLGTLVRNGLSFSTSKDRLTVTDDNDTILEGALVNRALKIAKAMTAKVTAKDDPIVQNLPAQTAPAEVDAGDSKLARDRHPPREQWLNMRIRHVFPPKLLTLAAQDPLRGQKNASPPPIMVDGINEWMVEDILDSKKPRGRLQYWVQWEGYDQDLTWLPAGSGEFDNGGDVVEKFHKKYPHKPR